MSTAATATEVDAPVIALIEEEIRRLLAVMGFTEATVTGTKRPPREDKSGHPREQLHIAIEAGEVGRLLIGVQGVHLAALQHIVRCIVHRRLTTPLYVTCDVNKYRERREKNVLELAEAMARRAQRTGRTVVLRPMSSADRRLVHNALSNRADVRTESMGDEPNRRVVVKPVFL